MKKILVIAPHPDDETLGCGGTLLKHRYSNDEIHWLILTNISEKYGWSSRRVNTRQLEIEKVAKSYKFSTVNKLDFPTTKLDTIPMSLLVEKITSVINNTKPQIIYINNYSDIHTDHQIAFKAVMSSVKSFRHSYINKLFMYETISETEYASPLQGHSFLPNVFVDITNYFEDKIRVMQEYKGELMEPPFPRSIDIIDALAKYRGSRIGVKYAEAFSLLFEKL